VVRSIGQWNAGDGSLRRRGAEHAAEAFVHVARVKAEQAEEAAAFRKKHGGGSVGAAGGAAGRGGMGGGGGGGASGVAKEQPVAVLDAWAMTADAKCGNYEDWVHHPRLAPEQIEAWLTTVLGCPCSLAAEAAEAAAADVTAAEAPAAAAAAGGAGSNADTGAGVL
jgi:hypothetical protein